ncbi:sugar transferase [Candidatus Woesearchaeota archaeon]|nr:sugar transferase [Candidatus Woesearchaeota archaeon]
MSYKLKRPIDLVGSLILGTLTIPLQAIITTSIVAEGLISKKYRRPIIYKSQRVGKKLKVFDMYKFSSMVQGADKGLSELISQYGHVNHIIEDPRVTPIGRILRRYSLDELPQFFNVLKGEMSLVGNRPRSPEEIIELMTKGHTEVAYLSPGITSEACINGRRKLNIEEMLKYDINYKPTILTDAKILCKTALKAWYEGN